MQVGDSVSEVETGGVVFENKYRIVNFGLRGFVKIITENPKQHTLDVPGVGIL